MSLPRTSMQQRSLQLVLDFARRIGARTSPVEQLEEEQFRMRERFERFSVSLVEDVAPSKAFGQNPALSEAPLKLRFFEASIQRTQLIGHFQRGAYEIPIHYSIQGALILERLGRRFRVWEEPMKNECIIAPFAFLENADSLKEEFSQTNLLSLVDSGAVEPDYTQLRISAVNYARQVKWQLRTKLISAWSEKVGKQEEPTSESLILINDTILPIENSQLLPTVVGLVKMTYVPFKGRENLPNFLLLPSFHRGNLMKIEEPGSPQSLKYSWFLRLRETSGAEPEFGLIRMEIIAQNDEQALIFADKLSEVMVWERLPVTYPAPNWDKLIFPHKLAEEYVESLFPTRETIRAFFKFA